MLSNYHFTNGVVRPNVPAIVEIGGIQIKPDTEPLPDVSWSKLFCSRINDDDLFVFGPTLF